MVDQPVGKSKSILRRETIAWCCYDWANSGYTTLLITVFVVYVQRVVFHPDEWGDTGAEVWAWGIAASMLLGAILSPILGSLADARAGKRRWLAITMCGGGVACLALALQPPSFVWGITGCFLIANLCLELSLTVYNGFLPELASEEEMNRVSAAGMGAGYFGGGLALLIAMFVLNYGESLGMPELHTRLRWCIVGTGLWWVVFSLPTVFILRDKRPSATATSAPTVSSVQAAKQAIGDTLSTLKQIRKYSTLALFLLAFLFFNDGVQTVISQSSTFALQEVHFTERELIQVVLMVQLVAVPGALSIGWLSDKVGRKQTLILCLLVWIGLLTSAWFVKSKFAYWCMAIGVAIVLGGTQAVSRAIVAVLTPKEHAAKFFGFFNLSGKATSFMGTFLFGLVIAMTGSSRLAIVNLLVFFVVGLCLVARLPINETSQGASASERSQG